MTTAAAVCSEHGVDPQPPQAGSKVGIAMNVRTNLRPLNGLRHAPEGDTNGWYIWAGEELEEDDDFFQPLHVEHIADWCPQVLPYLSLPPGWRFLLAGDQVDVWFDVSLLQS